MSQAIKWKVVSSGIIKIDFSEDAVISSLQKIFSLSEDNARKLVDGKPRTLKKNLTQDKAYQVKAALEKIGLNISLERMQVKLGAPLGLTLEPIEEKETKIQTDGDERYSQVKAGSLLQSNQMACPKCGHIQSKADDCIQCGIIISRFVQKQKDELFHGEPLAGNENVNVKKIPFWETNLARVLGGVIIVVFFIVKIFVLDQARFQPLGNSSEAVSQINSVRKSHNNKAPDLNHIRTLLESGKYTQVESVLGKLNDSVKYDISWEDAFQKTVDGMSPKNKFNLKTMHEWVSESGSSYAYMARGAYYASAGNVARGDCYANCTSKDQFGEQRDLHKKALNDLLEAKKKNSTLLPVYSLLLIAGSTQFDFPFADDILQEAISVHPGGYYYRFQYLRKKMPKWGGSYTEMNDFVEEITPYYSLNPRLWLLRGFASAEKGHKAMKNKSFGECITHYSDALQFGVHSGWLRYRANCLTDEGDYEQALEDINLSLEFHDNDFSRKLKRYLMSKQK